MGGSRETRQQATATIVQAGENVAEYINSMSQQMEERMNHSSVIGFDVVPTLREYK
jgi:hypothetical protein